MLKLKNQLTYFLFTICLFGVFCISFNSTVKLLKQSFSIVLNEIDSDDLQEEEDETENKEFEDDAKIIANFESFNILQNQQNQPVLIPIEAKLVSMFQNIQSPPPKI